MSGFSKVLTLCTSCKKPITVEASYADRNKPFKCESCTESLPFEPTQEELEAEG